MGISTTSQAGNRRILRGGSDLAPLVIIFQFDLMENQILKELETIVHRGYNSHDIFRDWLDLMLYALQRDDDNYLKIVHRYRNDKPQGQREIDHFANAFALLLQHMKQTNEEALGEIYMQWNISNKYSGQFFTPKNVARMMAEITKTEGHILDPTCGAGIMLVESAKTMTNAQLDNSVFFGQDLDYTCVKMTALNLLFFNLNGYVVQGDTLMMECNTVYQTFRSYIGGFIRELKGEEFEAFKKKYTGIVKNTPQLQATTPVIIPAKAVEQLKLI